MDNIINKILMVPQSTPREALYIETGLLNPEAIRLKNWVLMEHRLTSGNSQRMKKLTTNNTTTSKWAEETKKAKEQLEIGERDMKGEKNNCEKQNNQQSKRLAQGQNRKGEQWKIQNPTPTRRTIRMGTPKRSQIYEQTCQAAGQHYLQSQNKNAASEKQLQKQTPEPYLHSMWCTGGDPTACPGRLWSPAPSRWVQGIQQRNILRQPEQTQDNSNQHPKHHGPA